jgi:biotin carboxyl carrier protein
MTLELDVDGHAYKITIRADPEAGSGHHRLQVTVEALDLPKVVQRLDIREHACGTSVIDGEGRVFDAHVQSLTTGSWIVGLARTVVPVADRRRTPAQGLAVRAGVADHRISAPMPGRILRVLVEAGDLVKAGQPLIVIEAMKMENALTTRSDATVHEVLVTEGMSVEAGRLLLRLA